MKRLFFLLLTAGLFLTQVSNGQGSWIETEDGQINVKHVKVHKNTAKVVLDNGEKTKIPVSKISSYALDDVQYKKMSLFATGASAEQVLMEFIKSQDDMNLYRYVKSGHYRYYVYKGDDYYMEILDGSKSEFEKFFDVKIKI